MKTLMAALTLFAFLGAASIPPAAYAQATGGSTDTTSKSKKGKTHKTKTTKTKKQKRTKKPKTPTGSGTSTPAK